MVVVEIGVLAVESGVLAVPFGCLLLDGCDAGHARYRLFSTSIPSVRLIRVISEMLV